MVLMKSKEKPRRISSRIKLQFIHIHHLTLENKLILARLNPQPMWTIFSNNLRSSRYRHFKLIKLLSSRVIDLSLSEAAMKMTKTTLLNSSILKLSSLRLIENNLKSKGKPTSLYAIIKSKKELCKRSKTNGHT
jgi:hypothetical protein